MWNPTRRFCYTSISFSYWFWKLVSSCQSIRLRLDHNCFPTLRTVWLFFFIFFFFYIYLPICRCAYFYLIKSAQCLIAGLLKKLRVRKGRNWRNYSYLISLSFSSTDSQGLRSSLNSRSSMNKTKITSENTKKSLRIIASETKFVFLLRTLHKTPSHPPKRNWNGKWLLVETVRSNSHIALAN